MDLIAIGRISKPRGTHGELSVSPLTDDKQRFAGMESIWLGYDETAAEQREIEVVRIDAYQVVVRIKGVETAGEAETLRNKYLFVPQEKIINLRAGTYFIDDVIGCEVVTEDQKRVGRVSDLLTLPANDIWVVDDGEKEILIPAVKEIIRKVDIAEKRITIHALEGLIE
jgi:16S rRNA processing protein RimM